MSVRDGVATRSLNRADPVLHIVVPDGRGDATWCTGAPATLANTASRLRCRACTTLLRDGVAEGYYDQTDLDGWLASTATRRRRLYL